MASEQTEKLFKSCISEGKLIKARRMREEGISYRKIADALSVSESTLHYALGGIEGRERKSVSNARYRKDHKEEKAKYDREWCKNNPEYYKRYYKDHKERIDACSKKWRESHKEERAKYHREWCENNKKEQAEYSGEWRRNNPECIREWRESNRAKINGYSAVRRALIADTTVGDLDEIAEIYCRAEKEPNIRCYICGKLSQIGDRAVDHIFPVSKGGLTTPSNLAIVHTRCNLKKNDKMPNGVEIHDEGVVERARQDYDKLWLL